MGVGSVPGSGSGGAPVEGSPPPGGPEGTGGAPEGGKPPAGAEGAPEGGAPPGEDFGSFDGVVDQGEFLHMAEEAAGDDLAARQLVNTIRMNTVSHQGATGGGFHEMSNSASEHREGMTETHDARDAFVREGEVRAEARASIRDALASGDTRALKELFSRFSANDRAASRSNPNPSGNPANPAAGAPGKGVLGTPVASGGGTGGPAATGTPANPPIFPNATGPLATLTQPRMTALSGRIANMTDGAQKTEAQQLEAQLRAAISASPPDQEAARAALEGLAALGIELGPEEDTEEVGDHPDVSDGDADEGDASHMPPRAGGEGAGPRPRVARTFNPSEHLAEGMVLLSGGGGGGDPEVDTHGARMERGLGLVLSGGATRYATHTALAHAVHGTYAEGGGSGSGSGAGGGSGDGGVAFGAMVDTDGALAAGGYSLDTAAAGLGGSYGVRTRDGRFIPQWMALSEHGGLPPGVRAAVARDAGLRTRFGAEAVSGARAGMTGDLWAGMRC